MFEFEENVVFCYDMILIPSKEPTRTVLTQQTTADPLNVEENPQKILNDHAARAANPNLPRHSALISFCSCLPDKIMHNPYKPSQTKPEVGSPLLIKLERVLYLLKRQCSCLFLWVQMIRID